MALNINRLVNVTINLSPLAVAGRSFGVLNIAGDSTVINGLDRSRDYTSIDAVAADFGLNAPEYLAAVLYFGQSPKPAKLTISRWLRVASPGVLHGANLSATDQLLSNFTTITAGTLTVTVDGTVKNLTGLNFSGATNLNAVAAIIQTALAGPLCIWDGSKFKIVSSTTGTSSSVGYATGNIASVLKMQSGTAPALIPGYAPETAVQCAAALANKSPNWYGLMFAASVMPSDADQIAVAQFIEALSITRMFGVTTQNQTAYDSIVTSDIGSQLMALNTRQTFVTFSSQNPYAAASIFGRAFSVDFTANRSMITLMYKQEPGVIAEQLTETQANALQAKRINVFVAYANGTNILQYGVMSGQAYFDEIHGLDWFQDAVQTACFNKLYTSATKIPQTDAGVNVLTNAVAAVCGQAVDNGLAAPGTWTADGFGMLQTGQFLKDGYYVYAGSLALQSQADREARKSPPIQVALKLAGAIHTLNVMVNVNR